MDSGEQNNSQIRDLHLLHPSAAELKTVNFKLVYLVRNCGLIRLCHQNQHSQYYYCNKMQNYCVPELHFGIIISFCFSNYGAN